MASLQLDIMDKASIQAFTEQATSKFRALNVLINNAGILPVEDIKASSESLQDAEEMVAASLMGTICVSAAVLPHLLNQPRRTLVVREKSAS